MTLEICCHCGNPTGRAGIGEDSIYAGETGPFCSECRDNFGDILGEIIDKHSREAMPTPSPELVARLRQWTIDWNGEQMVRGTTPRDGLHCDILLDAASMIEGLVKERDFDRQVSGELIRELSDEKVKLMTRLERNYAFRLIDGELVRVEMELDDDTDGISCRDATIAELQDQLKSTFTHGYKAGLEAGAKMSEIWDCGTDVATAIRLIPIPEEGI